MSDRAGALSAGHLTSRLSKLAGRVAGLTGWHRYGVSAALGVLAAAAMPPVHLQPVLPIAFSGLTWLLGGSGQGRRGAVTAFLIGWSFGLGHFVVGLYWIVNAPLVYGIGAAAMLPLIPIISIGLPALLAVFPGGACMLAWLVGRRAGPAAFVLTLAAAWIGFEWLRGHVLSGFPWNLAGYVWANLDAMLQGAAVVGAYGLGALTVCAAAMPALLVDLPPAWRAPRGRWGMLVAAAGVMALTWAWGTWRLAEAGPSDALAMVPDVRLRVVQPNIIQSDKWRRDRLADNFRLHLRLTAGGAPGAFSHAVWPETAMPSHFTNNPLARQQIAKLLPPGGALISGAPRRTKSPDPPQVWNSLVAISDQAEIVARFDKFHLVPFGEYVPLKAYLPLAKVVQGRLDYSPGGGPRTLRVANLPPFSPLICYEVIFPGAILDRADPPDWLLNITNDAWFGESAGPHQHLAIARFRAVEEGLPLIRSANTGISAVIDPYGRVMARLPIGVRGVIDSELPMALRQRTMYSRLGDWIVPLLIICLMGLSLLTMVGRSRRAFASDIEH